MQGVPEIEGMQKTESPLAEIEEKTVIELFGIRVCTDTRLKRTVKFRGYLPNRLALSNDISVPCRTSYRLTNASLFDLGDQTCDTPS
jgi:hypothetical protein